MRSLPRSSTFQLFSGVGSLGQTQANQGGTAFFAHIGGFIAGIGLVYLMGTKERYSSRRDSRTVRTLRTSSG